MEAIKLDNLTKHYGKNRGIDNVSFSVNKGEIFGFVGPNGAGKSTTIRTLLNLIYPTAGSASILGMDIVKDAHKLKKIIGYVPSEVKFYDNVKVKEIINYAASFYEKVDKDEINRLCSLLEVDLNKKMGELSLGNKKKVAIVQAFLSKPELVILDEPTNGLDPLVQNKLFNLIADYKKQGKTIFLSSHNLSEVQNYCDKVAVIKEGRIIDIINIKEESAKLGLKITLAGDDINSSIIEKFGGTSICTKNNEIAFNYLGSVDTLIKNLSSFNISKLLITEKTLEDTFIDYYK